MPASTRWQCLTVSYCLQLAMKLTFTGCGRQNVPPDEPCPMESTQSWHYTWAYFLNVISKLNYNDSRNVSELLETCCVRAMRVYDPTIWNLYFWIRTIEGYALNTKLSCLGNSIRLCKPIITTQELSLWWILTSIYWWMLMWVAQISLFYSTEILFLIHVSHLYHSSYHIKTIWRDIVCVYEQKESLPIKKDIY